MAFNVYDIDGNGFITPDEMKELLESLYKVSLKNQNNEEKTIKHR